MKLILVKHNFFANLYWKTIVNILLNLELLQGKCDLQDKQHIHKHAFQNEQEKYKFICKINKFTKREFFFNFLCCPNY